MYAWLELCEKPSRNAGASLDSRFTVDQLSRLIRLRIFILNAHQGNGNNFQVTICHLLGVWVEMYEKNNNDN